MARVTFSPEARRDLIEITDHLYEIAGPRTARKYETQIRRVIEHLRDFPGVGPPRSEFGTNVRMLVVRPYLVFYDDQSGQGEVLILRILHGARDIDERLLRKGRE